jgi:hypothetical protein
MKNCQPVRGERPVKFTVNHCIKTESSQNSRCCRKSSVYVRTTNERTIMHCAWTRWATKLWGSLRLAPISQWFFAKIDGQQKAYCSSPFGPLKSVWFESYITDRKQFVRIGSSVLTWNSGPNLEQGLTQNLSKPWDSRPSGGRKIWLVDQHHERFWLVESSHKQYFINSSVSVTRPCDQIW